MPKVKEWKRANRLIIHVGELWKQYDKHPEQFEFRQHDVGRKEFTYRIPCKYRNKWHTYAWSFLKSQVSKSDRTLICKDKSAYDILSKMKEKGDLKGYKVIRG